MPRQGGQAGFSPGCGEAFKVFEQAVLQCSELPFGKLNSYTSV